MVMLGENVVAQEKPSSPNHKEPDDLFIQQDNLNKIIDDNLRYSQLVYSGSKETGGCFSKSYPSITLSARLAIQRERVSFT